MYNLPYFKEKDQQVVLDFIKQNPFAFVCGCSEENKPSATQLPLFLEEKNEKLFLVGHLMKQQDHHKAFEYNPNVLCVFTAAHSYVSATWYTNPQQASTWNYMSVHVKGKMQFLGDEALIEVLRKTSLHFENYNEKSPTSYDNLPVDYREKLMKAIIAFEIEVESIDNVFKLSQNRDKESYQTIINELEQKDEGGKFIAGEMKKRMDG